MTPEPTTTMRRLALPIPHWCSVSLDPARAAEGERLAAEIATKGRQRMDLLTELRQFGADDPLMVRAADEIERLRAEVADMIEANRHEQEMLRQHLAQDREDQKWREIYGR